jgi:hypothetical protein
MHLRATFVVAVTVLTVACSAEEDGLDGITGGREVVELLNGDALLVGAYEMSGTCFAYRTQTVTGSHCMRALGPGGWAVETSLIGEDGSSALLVGADPSVVEVRVPLKAGGHLTVRPGRIDGVPQHVDAIALDPATVDLTGNGVTAYDGAGVLLGRTHDCAGLGGTPDCGPYDGVFDKRIQPTPTPPPR